MSILPPKLKNFVEVFTDVSLYQLGCILNTISIKQLKIIVEIVFNLLYNKSIKLSPSQTRGLRKFVPFFEELSDKKIPLKRKRVLITKYPLAVQKALIAINSF